MLCAISEIDLIVPLLVFLFCVAEIYLKHKKTQLRHEERRLMIEKGLVPHDLEEKKPGHPENWLRWGLILFFLGIGLGLAGLVADSDYFAEFELVGIVVGFLGLGPLVYYFITRNQSDKAAESA